MCLRRCFDTDVFKLIKHLWTGISANGTGISADWTGISAHLFRPFFQFRKPKYKLLFQLLATMFGALNAIIMRKLLMPLRYFFFLSSCASGHRSQNSKWATTSSRGLVSPTLGKTVHGSMVGRGLFHFIAYRVLLLMVAPTLGH